MFTYEFSTTITEDGAIFMPSDYANQLSKGERVYVIVVVDKSKISQPKMPTDELAQPSLAELVERIKSKPSESANITLGNMMSLAERLAHPIYEPDLDFDADEWDRQWAQIEAEMDAEEEAKSNQRLQEMARAMSLP